MCNTNIKRTYHPLIILLYKSNILSLEQIKSIPRTTRWVWDNTELSNNFGGEWASEYMIQFNDIKLVYSKKYFYKSIRLICKLNESYHQLLTESNLKIKLIRKHKNTIVNQIDGLMKATKISVTQVCKLLKVNYQWYYRQKNKIICQLSLKKSCFKLQVNQLTIEEVSKIEKIVTSSDNQQFCLTTLYYKALNSCLLFCSKNTFSNYAKIFRTFRKVKTKGKPKIGFRAEKPFEWLHVDITYVPTLNDGVQKLAFVKDNFSKAILHHKSSSTKADSNFIKDLFQETFDKYNLFNASNPINILSDGGPENKGHFLEWIENIQAPPQVLKLTAKTEEFPYSNSMSESTHSIYKSEFLQKRTLIDEKDFLNSLPTFVDYYNNQRFPGDHYGLTPSQVLEGEVPNKKMFFDQIQQSRKDRIEYNKNVFDCKLKYCF
jgi:hypothetical protein